MPPTPLQLCSSAMETAVHKLPSFKILNARCSTARGSASFRVQLRRSSSSLSVSASAVREGDLALGSVSLGHITRPDFPILHQVLTPIFVRLYLQFERKIMKIWSLCYNLFFSVSSCLSWNRNFVLLGNELLELWWPEFLFTVQIYCVYNIH